MEPISIAGKRFKAVEKSTMRHDIATRDILLRMGMSRFSPHEGESEAAAQERLLGAILDSDELFSLLGHMLMPADELTWTPAMAGETAEFLANLTAPPDKALLVSVIVDLALFFCLSVVGFTMISRRSSQVARSALGEWPTVAPATSATGASYSAM